MDSARNGATLPGRKPSHVPTLFAPVFVLLLLLAAVISVPWTYIQKSVQRRRERKFAGQMNRACRSVHWQEFKQAVQNGAGTTIGEYLSPKGPFRLWWTPEDVRRISPYEWKREQHHAFPVIEPDLLPFFEWCYVRYTHPDSGAARLVSVPESERKQLKAALAEMSFVSICSYRSLRHKIAAAKT